MSTPKVIHFMHPLCRRSLPVLSLLIYVGTIPAYFFLPVRYRHEVTSALLFSYPGTLSRYLLSIYLNPLWNRMPLGTLTANLFGTALLGAIHVLQNKQNMLSPTICSLLQGIADGYCGCLTTVSTFASEVLALEEGRRWQYIFVSWTASQLLLLVILEPSFHAGNIARQQTCHFVA
jgi:CrcB protein